MVKIDIESLAICKKNKEATLNSKRWCNMHDDKGNPLFETIDKENSSEYEEDSSEDDDKQFSPERTVQPTPSQGGLDSRGEARIS